MEYTPNTTGIPEPILRELRRISEMLGFLSVTPIPVVYAAPEKPQDGQPAICDGVLWDPLADGVKRPLWYDRDTTSWKKFD